ncbi:MAG: PAS domain-containing protein [Deltaproteobacteria bacterium]
MRKVDRYSEAGSTVTIDRGEYELLKNERWDMRKHYLRILDSVPANISYVDAKEYLRFVNRWHEKWFDSHPKEIIGKSIREICGELYYQGVAHHIKNALAGAEVSFETAFSTEFGLRSFAVTLVPNMGDTEPVLGFYIMAFDITDRKMAEEALSRSEREKALILTSVSEVVTYMDSDLRVVWANRAGGDSMGLTVADLTGRYCYELSAHRDQPCECCPVVSAIKTGELQEGELTMPDRRVWLVRAYPVKAENGEVIGVVKVSREISARKHAEERLKKKELQLEEAQQIAHMGSWEYDLHKNRLSCSKELYRICDLTPGGKRLTFKTVMRVVHPDDLNRVKIAIETAYQTQNHFSLFHRIVRSNGTSRILHSQGKIVVDVSGVPVRMIGTAQDVTSRKKTEEVLKSKHRALKEFNQILERRVGEEVDKNREKDFILIRQSRQAAMGEMIGNIAHQWRQPLTTISLLIQDLSENYCYGEFTQEYLDKTIDHAMQVIQSMSRTIDDFRNFFKPDNQKVSFLVAEAIRKTISFAGPGLMENNIQVVLETDGALFITGYPNEYAQALFSIVTNAKDALLEKRVEKPSIYIGLSSAHGKVLVTVADNAGGIPEEFIDKIFDPYFTTKKFGEAIGVGLYMAKTIIEKHMGGKLSARNISGGAKFSIEV